MLKAFECPACAASLEFDGGMMQGCNYCGANIIVPSDNLRLPKPPGHILKYQPNNQDANNS